MVRFVHTSDWHLGMTRHFLEGEAQARYTAARIDAIRAIGQLAERASAEFVVVAGDVFDSNLVATQTVRRALEAMAAVPVPVYLLPGNHDPLDAVTVYRSRLFDRLKPPNVHVLDSSGPVAVGAGVELVAAPWFSKHPLGDLAGQALAALAPQGEERSGIRILVAHGVLDVLSPQEKNPAAIAFSGLEEALTAGTIDYAALGDKHTRLALSERLHYPGSPEVTSFREELPGDALVVDLQAGRDPIVTPHHVGTWRFVGLERDLLGDDDIGELDEALGALDPKDRTVVQTGLRGTLSLQQKARLDALLDAYGEVFAACLPWLSRQNIAVLLGDDELADLGIGGFVDEAIADLADLAGLAQPGAVRHSAGSPERSGSRVDHAERSQADVAREALSLLYRLAKGPAA
ncbi:putative hydrolase [Kineosphaera limosa NBRC 100340]|uniref:Nuclease SbcCD subunit D n=1 Tax=Kineosphaera limosa NBRC 100340 TaxID=1184609 RepID=K6VNT0_9MICO|nr:exonuclease SbcCD subunit D [Kineosphaera limosa]GAB97858.1 putative hydrolase [Kineosphaera limosa NBRC 100340]